MNEILIYDDIGRGPGQVSDQDLVRQLEAAGGIDLNLRINSYGGCAYTGQAMLAALDRYPGKVTAYVDSVAGSAAQMLTLVADRTVMAQGSWQMIHEAWGQVAGSARELVDEARKHARLLKGVDTSLARRIATKTGRQITQAREWMRDETWFPAEEAVAAGLADEVGQVLAVAACGSADRFRNVPKMLQQQAENEAPGRPQDLRHRHFETVQRRMREAAR